MRSVYRPTCLHTLLLLSSHSAMSTSLWPHGPQLVSAAWPLPSLGVCSNSCPLSRWCYLSISLFAALFSLCPQSFPARGSFPVTQLFASDGQSIGASASASLFNESSGFICLGLTGLISLLSKGLSRVFSSTTIRKHQFFSCQWSNSHIHTCMYVTTGKIIAFTI